MMKLRLAAIVFCMLALAGICFGQWGSGSCDAVASPQYAEGWYDAGNGRIDLYSKGFKIGTLDPVTSEWTTAGNDKPVNLREAFGLVGARPMCCCNGKCKPACDCNPCGPEKCEKGCKCGKCDKKDAMIEGVQNFGIDTNRLKVNGPDSYKVNGRPASREEAHAAIAGGTLTDDSKSRRVVVLGSEAKRKQVAADWPGLGIKDVIFQTYDANHWHVKDVGYKQFGDPTIYVVDAGGKVLHRQDYYDGPEKLAAALRKTDPNYDPAKDPDVNKPKVDPKPDPPKSPVDGGVVAGLLGAGLIGLGAYGLGKRKGVK